MRAISYEGMKGLSVWVEEDKHQLLQEILSREGLSFPEFARPIIDKYIENNKVNCLKQDNDFKLLGIDEDLKIKGGI